MGSTYHPTPSTRCLVPTCTCEGFTAVLRTVGPLSAGWKVVHVVSSGPSAGLHYVHLRGSRPPYIGETVVLAPPPPTTC